MVLTLGNTLQMKFVMSHGFPLDCTYCQTLQGIEGECYE